MLAYASTSGVFAVVPKNKLEHLKSLQQPNVHLHVNKKKTLQSHSA